MALTYSRDPVAGVVHITYAANPRFEEWAEMMRAIMVGGPWQ